MKTYGRRKRVECPEQAESVALISKSDRTLKKAQPFDAYGRHSTRFVRAALSERQARRRDEDLRACPIEPGDRVLSWVAICMEQKPASRTSFPVRSSDQVRKALLRVISLISFFMAQLLVRDLEDAVVQALKQKAAEEGTSVEEAHRRILRLALLSKKPKKGFKEFLLEMPEGGDDYIFDRHRSQPREVLL